MPTKVFISWSGVKSEPIAERIARWLPRVIQAVQPFHSPKIDKGTLWLTQVLGELAQTKYGVICVTREELSPWVLFEAGALAKQIGEARVCPVLFDVETTALTGPLAAFPDVTEGAGLRDAESKPVSARRELNSTGRSIARHRG